MFYIFSQNKKIVIPFLKDTLIIKETKKEFELCLICNNENKYVPLGKFKTKNQCIACIRKILDKYVDCHSNGYYEINSAEYYNY